MSVGGGVGGDGDCDVVDGDGGVVGGCIRGEVFVVVVEMWKRRMCLKLQVLDCLERQIGCNCCCFLQLHPSSSILG